jgi:predicted transposase YdaD
MPNTKDILSKVWLRRGSDGILSRRLCGGKIAEHLPTDQPQVSARQADILIRNDRDEIHHIEFQSFNEKDFGFRMLDYWVYLRRQFGRPIHQCVFYIGSEPLRLSGRFEEGRTIHSYAIVNLQDYEASELLASPDWGDNLWALGAKGDRRIVLRELLLKLSQLDQEQRKSALAELTAFSGILKLEELFKQSLKDFPVLDYDLRKHAVIRPMIEEAESLGRQEGRQEGTQSQLLDLLAEKFGPVPAAITDRVHAASAEEVGRWARRILRANSIEETLS